MIILDRVYVAKGINVSSRTIMGIAYIVLEDRDVIHSLNESGSYIWDIIDGMKTIRQVITLVQNEYVGDEEDIRQSVFSFISELSDQGMIELSDMPFTGVMCSV